MSSDMKKVGLVTIYSVPNFGSVLQTFATQVILESLGYDCCIINYNRDNSWYYSNGVCKTSLKSKIALYLGIKSHHRMALKLMKFRKDFLHFSKRYNSLGDLANEDWSGYYAFVVGSDQVWNTRFSYGDSVYMLSFVPDNIIKIALSSSFSMKVLPGKYLSKFRKYLGRLDSISVRELYGREIINNQLGLNKHVEVILDPTLILSSEDWMRYVPRSGFVKKEKFILLYVLDYAFNPKPYIYDVVKFFQRNLGYRIYVLSGVIPKEYRSSLNIKDVVDSSIFEFVDYFNNADLVITSSFHGTAFALNFGKPLISIVPDGGDDRQSSLLNVLGLSKLAIKVGTELTEISFEYNYDEEQSNLRALRETAINWIRTALGICQV